MSDAEHLVRDIYVEAAVSCGDDLGAINLYVAKRLSELSEDDQRRFRSVTDRVLAFHSPTKRPEHDH